LCRIHSGTLNAVTKRLIAKEAIKIVHDNILQGHSVVVADPTEDRLGWAILCSKHSEARKFDGVEKDMSCFPRLRSTGKPENKLSMYLSEREFALHIQAVRDLIVELAREDITNDIEELRNAPEEQSTDREQCKEHILRKLTRITPGESTQLGCVIDGEGVFHSAPRDMAKVLCGH
jgi:hypothetical protein